MLLEVQHIRKQFQNLTHALADVSFSVGQGEFVSVIGPSGAGKTTLFRILNGAIRCDGGAVLMNGVHFEAAAGRARRTLQKTIGTIYQDFALVENATCRQNVLNACLPDMTFLPAVLGLFGKERTAEADALLTRVGLADKVEEPVKNLSGGQKQRVAIARALMRHSAGGRAGGLSGPGHRAADLGAAAGYPAGPGTDHSDEQPQSGAVPGVFRPSDRASSGTCGI